MLKDGLLDVQVQPEENSYMKFYMPLDRKKII